MTSDWEAIGGPGISPLVRRGFSALETLSSAPAAKQSAADVLLHRLYQTCEKPGPSPAFQTLAASPDPLPGLPPLPAPWPAAAWQLRL